MHADPVEAERFLEAHPAIEAVQVVVTDASGVARGKNVAREELTALYTQGRNVAGSILGLDMRGEDVEETGLVWSSGDADKTCWPLPGTLKPAPWLSRPTGQLLMTMHEADGSPAAADPRHALARVVDRLLADGYRPVVAVELEFYLVEPDAERILPATGLMTGERSARHDAYGLGKLDEMSPLFDEVYRAARLQSLPARTLMSEYAPGQFEVTLEHRADALAAADDAIQWKRLVRGVATRHGRIATFMAKPFGHLAGSGMHVHVSLAGPGGDNLFASDDPTILAGRRCSRTRSAGSRPCCRRRWRCSRRTPTPTAGSGDCRTLPWQPPGVSTTGRSVSVSLPGHPRPVTSSTASRAPMPIPT